MTTAAKPGTPHPASGMWVYPRHIVLLTALILLPATAHPQGCTQCADSTRATPPATQSAYREAILFLAGAAGTVFITTLVILKRHR